MISVEDHPTMVFPVAGEVGNYNPVVGIDGVIGLKSGFTSASQGCLVTAAAPHRRGAHRPHRQLHPRPASQPARRWGRSTCSSSTRRPRRSRCVPSSVRDSRVAAVRRRLDLGAAHRRRRRSSGDGRRLGRAVGEHGRQGVHPVHARRAPRLAGRRDHGDRAGVDTGRPAVIGFRGGRPLPRSGSARLVSSRRSRSSTTTSSDS